MLHIIITIIIIKRIFINLHESIMQVHVFKYLLQDYCVNIVQFYDTHPFELCCVNLSYLNYNLI